VDKVLEVHHLLVQVEEVVLQKQEEMDQDLLEVQVEMV
jgi:hypothetical protein